MQIINGINYPILNFLGTPNLWAHRAFRDIWRTLTPEEAQKAMAEGARYAKLLHFDALIQNPTGKRTAAWPMMAVGEDDFNAMGKETFLAVTELVQTIWSFTAKSGNTPVEIVTGSLWDSMYYNAPKGYDEWLDKAVKTNRVFTGILLRPYERITEMYAVMTGEKMYEMSLVVSGRTLLWCLANGTGFVSSALDLSGDIEKVASSRGCTLQEAFHQEDIYNILKYTYFKEHFLLRPRRLAKGETLAEEDGTPAYRLVTDIPCITYDNALAS